MNKMILLLSSVIGLTNGANILLLFPLPLYSHTNTFMPVFKELATRGHNITMVTPFPQKKLMANWTDVVIKKSELLKILETAVNNMSNQSKYIGIMTFWNFCLSFLEGTYKDKQFQHFINRDDLNFDLIIMEPFFAYESLVSIGHKLKTPILAIHPFALSPWSSYLTGNPIISADHPYLRSKLTNEMNFIERLENTIIHLIELITGLSYYLPLQEKLMNKYMVYPGSEHRPPLVDLLKNVSLTLIDSDSSIGYHKAYQPNIIPVGGLSLKSSDPLPVDLQKFMDNSRNGVIYLSFGSILSVALLDGNFLDAIISVFKKLDMNILMKWENDTMENKPNNVEIRKWFPQTSILAHPNCVLFITHGGLHGITEAAYHGVPILGIPYFADQEYNLGFVARAGFGYMLLRKDITEETFQHAVEAVIYNSSYKENVVKRSLIVRDKPQSPLSTAIYWIEYALRHKDLSHLKPSAISINFPICQLLFLDVIIVLVLVLLSISIFIYIIFKTIIGYIINYKNMSKRKKD